eukprot:gene6791-10955_t
MSNIEKKQNPTEEKIVKQKRPEEQEEKTKPLKRKSSQQQTLDVFLKKQKTETKTIELDKKGSIIHYQPTFIEKKESNDFFHYLLDNIPWTESTIKMYGKDVKVPRLQCVMTDMSETKLSVYSVEKAMPWTKEIKEVKEKIEKDYRDGNDSIHYHQDKEAIGENCNTIASLSLGETRRFLIKNIENQKNIKEYALTCGSLIVMTGRTQEYWKHSVPKQPKIKTPRINLTFRQAEIEL